MSSAAARFLQDELAIIAESTQAVADEFYQFLEEQGKGQDSGLQV